MKNFWNKHKYDVWLIILIFINCMVVDGPWWRLLISNICMCLTFSIGVNEARDAAIEIYNEEMDRLNKRLTKLIGYFKEDLNETNS